MRPPPAAAAAERDVLLATKLHVPQPRPGFLPRPRLLERLTQGTARELVLVCTPAGFGKTSCWPTGPEEAVAALAARTEGWVAGLQLPGAAGWGARLVALLPAVRRPAARPPRSAAARPPA